MAPPAQDAETWPPRHRVHKYWGRKPANLVRACIERHTAPGDLVVAKGTVVTDVDLGYG